MTPERVADALERYMVAVIKRETAQNISTYQAQVITARQTFLNELRLLLGVITAPPGRSNERIDELRAHAQDEAAGRAQGRAQRRRFRR